MSPTLSGPGDPVNHRFFLKRVEADSERDGIASEQQGCQQGISSVCPLSASWMRRTTLNFASLIKSVVALPFPRCLQYVRQESEMGRRVQPPFPEDDISQWLDLAHADVQVDEEFEIGLGGTRFDASDEQVRPPAWKRDQGHVFPHSP